MHTTLEKLKRVKNKVNEIISRKQLKTNPKIIVVTKTFSLDKITPLIESGHIHFGENKIQEAESKWLDVKNKYKNLKLHMLGKLQTNKVKKAVKLFDYIHSVDNIKLAEKISKEQIKNNKKMKLFIQINIGNEDQKTGISEDRLENFFNICTKELDLNVIGIMCLPPNDNQPSKYFSKMIQLIKKIKLKETSMGMSNDYLDAVSCQSTYLRIGSKIFGERN